MHKNNIVGTILFICV